MPAVDARIRATRKKVGAGLQRVGVGIQQRGAVGGRRGVQRRRQASCQVVAEEGAVQQAVQAAL